MWSSMPSQQQQPRQAHHHIHHPVQQHPRGVIRGAIDPLDRVETPGISAEETAALLDGLDETEDEAFFAPMPAASGDVASPSKPGHNPNSKVAAVPAGAPSTGASTHSPPPSAEPSSRPPSAEPHVAQGPNEKSSLYIRNLHAEADDLFLYRTFAPHGAIFSVRVMLDEETGACRGIGFVNFLRRSEALAAINALNGKVAPGSGSDRVLQISMQSPRDSRASVGGGVTPRISSPGLNRQERKSMNVSHQAREDVLEAVNAAQSTGSVN